MKTETPFLDFYKKHIEVGRLPHNGLCNSIHYRQSVFDLFEPTREDRIDLSWDGHCTTYWASGLKRDHRNEEYKFTQLRQTIVLFCAAINNEL